MSLERFGSIAAAAGEASSPFLDPPGHHRPVMPPDPSIADTKPATDRHALAPLGAAAVATTRGAAEGVANPGPFRMTVIEPQKRA